jgi:hypothetical protein
MNQETMIRRVALGVLGGLTLLSSCATAPTGGAQLVPEARTFVYGDNAGSLSRVERSIGADGQETLHGETEISRAGRIGRVVEDASIDAQGNLLHAEIAVFSRCNDQADKQLSFDRARGLVEIRTPERLERWRVLSDAPWAILPPSDAGGNAVATPVSAWIALRAASGGAVRIIDTDHRWTYRAPSDQVAVATGEGTTVALGDDGVDAGKDFVDTLRLNGAGLVLKRLDAPAAPELACGSFGHPGVSSLQ